MMKDGWNGRGKRCAAVSVTCGYGHQACLRAVPTQYASFDCASFEDDAAGMGFANVWEIE